MNYSKYLKEVLTEPGIISSCYENFHNYSFGNQLLAYDQLTARNLNLSPIAPYKKWQDLGRQVKKGEKALELLQPVPVKEKDESGKETGKVFTFFKPARKWFSYDQTEPIPGAEEYKPEVKIAEWDAELALNNLLIVEEEYSLADGNCQGYAREGFIAVNPVAEYPHKTRFHEIAHNVLGHTAEGRLQDDEKTAKNIKEVEAESTAYILCQLLGLPGAEESKGYVQHWLQSDEITDKSAQKIFAAVDKILKAGQKEAVA
jgi:antirestriction protein ArdC